jgi:ABC-2 type transport system ATP-binding protein
VLVYELTPLQASLEEAYMELTASEVEYSSHDLPLGPQAQDVPEGSRS